MTLQTLCLSPTSCTLAERLRQQGCRHHNLLEALPYRRNETLEGGAVTIASAISRTFLD